ncbi:MAG: DNA-directed DNA polymerase II large subunit [Methanolinea sp.]|nr:DNA-directed DNA polymerase II large subunit [Methanolinea sp.]
MFHCSPSMEEYIGRLQDGLSRAMEVARRAREKGIDPRTHVEIPVAHDLAERVEALLGIPGLADRIRELEGEVSREEAALRIGLDFVQRRFGEKSREEVLDRAIRTAMAILTEGVVAAPTEGIAKVGTGRNDDGTEYLKIYYAGPIRSAGGTAQALSVLVGDFVRRELGMNRYIPRPEEVERYIEEIRQYNAIMNLQYLPSDDEIRLIVRNCPVCIDGEGTEQEEVSGYRNLERVETNAVRGGMALVIAEGLALKAPKILRHVRALSMDGWDWLEDLTSVATKPGGAEEGGAIAPRDKYLRDLIGGRPVFAYPMRKGGFRLRYGRSRNTGLAAAGLSPATMHILGDYLAVGTQMKIERPGKAAGIVPVDTIQGPTVRLRNGDVLRIDDAALAVQLKDEVELVLDVGEILIGYGEFLENNHPLVPPAYCHEWWVQEGGKGYPRTEEEAIALCFEGAFLHPDFTYLWDDITPSDLRELSDYVSGKGEIRHGILVLPPDPRIKYLLEEILLPHRVREGQICISDYLVFIACLGLDIRLSKRPVWETAPPGCDALALASHLSGFPMRSRAGTRIGGRMGRPGKSRPRKMNPPPHGLFPLGEAGGSRRSFQEAQNHAPQPNMDGGIITVETGRRRCPSCGAETFRNMCTCGAHTEPVYSCPRCRREVGNGTCPACHVPASCATTTTLNVKQEYLQAVERLSLRESGIALVKGVRGLISREKSVEPIEKGILRAARDIYVFKDGTVRFDMIDLPLTHVRPREIGVSPEKLRELGYATDTGGRPLVSPDQVVELRPQDILLSDSCAEYMVRVAQFVDDLLVKCYDLPPFYKVETRDDLLGHLVIGLAPHTSAGVLARIVGFTRANVGYAHPFFHAAKRRNCFYGDTLIETFDGREWSQKPIRQIVAENFDLSRPGIDRLGTYYSDPRSTLLVRTVDIEGKPHLRRVTSVSVHRAPPALVRFETRGGRSLAVTPDHAMLVWDLCFLRKVRAVEVKEGDAVPVMVGTNVLSDHVARKEIVPCPDERVYCLTVTDEHTVCANGIFTGQCDGDEDCIMLLLDGLINFSRTFLPETRGGTMDAPLVLTTRLDPAEIDKESHNLDVGSGYPLEFYLAAARYAHPREVEDLVDRVGRRLGTPAQLEGFSFTHDTSDISAGPIESTYTEQKSMIDKLRRELELAEKIRAVDEHDVAERVLSTHFIRDLMGNLSAFSRQKFRCTKCNASFRRMPLAGKCNRCGGNIVPTVHEGSVKKYLEVSREICEKYRVSDYTRQRVAVLDMAIESTFGREKSEQKGLADFM